MVGELNHVQILEMARKSRKSQAAPVPGRDLFLREWRKHRGLTQEQIEGRVGKSAVTISQLENHRINYTQEHVELLAQALNIEPADLFYPPPQPDKPLSEFELWARKATDEEKALAVRLVAAARTKAA